MVEQKKLLATENLSEDLNYNFSFKIWESLSDEDIKMSTDGSLSFTDKVKGRMENIAETYASLYDEIVQDHENGTRKINVADNESEHDYRTLTMEEEISALDKAYEKTVKTVESIVQQQPKIQKAYEEYREKLEKIGVGRAELANRYTAQSQNSVESIPENIYEKLISARDNWKNSYHLSSRFTSDFFKSNSSPILQPQYNNIRIIVKYSLVSCYFQTVSISAALKGFLLYAF